MPTEITFSGGHSIVVEDPLDLVMQNIAEKPYGRPLLRYALAKRDVTGAVIDVHVNWITIAYVREAKGTTFAYGKVGAGDQTTFGGVRDNPL